RTRWAWVCADSLRLRLAERRSPRRLGRLKPSSCCWDYLVADGILMCLVWVLAATNGRPWWTALGLSVLDLAVALGILMSPDASALPWPAPRSCGGASRRAATGGGR